MRNVSIFLIAAALAGCAGVDKALEYERKVYVVSMPEGDYRIFEHPKRDRLMTTPSLDRVLGQSVLNSATLGMATNMNHEARQEAAARKYLDTTGRAHCTITRGYLLIEPQYEFLFECPATSSIARVE